jgi:hypothetical protein
MEANWLAALSGEDFLPRMPRRLDQDFRAAFT